jgi:hypothetical protein
MRQFRRSPTQRPPGELRDETPRSIVARLNDIVRYLVSARTSTESDANLSTMYNDLDKLKDRIATLERASAHARLPEPEQKPQPEKFLVEPPIRWARVVECYKGYGDTIWTVPEPGFEFPTHCKANPCSSTVNQFCGPSWLDETVDLYIVFPHYIEAGNYKPLLYGLESGVGVTYCPASTIIPYFECKLPALPASANVPTGIEAGRLRQLPYVLETSAGGTSFVVDGWGAILPIVSEITFDGNGHIAGLTEKTLYIDPCGRIVRVLGS